MKKTLGTILLLAAMVSGISHGAVVINEFCYDPAGVDTGNEWVEIYNNGTETVNLTGYDLDPSDTPYYTFPDFTLPAGAYVLIHINAAGTDTNTDLYTGETDNNMSNTQGVIALFNSTTHATDTIVDYVEYGAGGQTNESKAVGAGIWTADDYTPGVDEGHSLEYDGSGNASSDWIDQAIPTPGVDNTLPIELSNFIAQVTLDGVVLEWKTESELSNAGFNLYRIEDGEFVKLNAALIEGAGTTAIPQEYKFVDDKFEDGSKYVIESVAFDGETSSSEAIDVTLSPQKSKLSVLWGRLKGF